MSSAWHRPQLHTREVERTTSFAISKTCSAMRGTSITSVADALPDFCVLFTFKTCPRCIEKSGKGQDGKKGKMEWFTKVQRRSRRRKR